jgi:hypothetical protein
MSCGGTGEVHSRKETQYGKQVELQNSQQGRLYKSRSDQTTREQVVLCEQILAM